MDTDSTGPTTLSVVAVETPAGGVEIAGTVAPGYEPVRDAFARNFAEHGEAGAAFSLVHDGVTVVDVWGGVADVHTGAPYTRDTLQLVFSTTKGATAVCANLLAQRGELDVDAPVASYWPEFAQAGKGDIPVRWLLCHKSGLPYVNGDLDLADALRWEPPVEALAAMEPLWEPGTGHGYHAVTYGWLVGEVIRRVTGLGPGEFFAREVAGPLGLDFWIGLPADEQDRVAPLTNSGPRLVDGRPGEETVDGTSGLANLVELIEEYLGPDAMLAKALGGATGMPFIGDGVFNRPEVRAAVLPAANGVTNARSLARMYAALLGPVPGGPPGSLLAPEQVTAAATTQTSGADKVLIFDSTFGLGFMTASAFTPYGTPGGFGHSGAGGSVGFADPNHGVGFGYVMNRTLANIAGDPRSRGLIQAAYQAIGVEPAFL